MNNPSVATCTLEQAASTLISKIQSLRIDLPNEVKLIRLEEAVPPLQLRKWLSAQQVYPSIYWADRDLHSESAALGTSHEILWSGPVDYKAAVSQMRSVLNTDNSGSASYFGGFRFDSPECGGQISSDWQKFGGCRFWLPAVEIVRTGDSFKLAVNTFSGNDNIGPIEILNGLLPAPEETVNRPAGLIQRENNPQPEDWAKAVNDALTSIKSDRTRKMVLARTASIRSDAPVDPWSLLERLSDSTVACSLFCFAPDDQIAFLGATPEYLYRRQGNQIFSEAIAGTRERGQTEQEDIRLENELNDSAKESAEHKWVSGFIGERLKQLCDRLDCDKSTSILKLARVQHLHTSFSGELKQGMDDADLLLALHPTPAVGGYPSADAVAQIEKLEPFDRGWYAGPVGWLRRDSAEFAVAIRSGLIAGNRITLYSGAGIVDGSTAEAEWNETEHKLSHFIRAIESNS